VKVHVRRVDENHGASAVVVFGALDDGLERKVGDLLRVRGAKSEERRGYGAQSLHQVHRAPRGKPMDEAL
jgi:hypothetical protein